MNCRHCKTRKANRSRGLCWTCFYTPEIRQLYPPRPGGEKSSGPNQPPRCIGCNTRAPRRNHLAQHGWRTRIARHFGQEFREVHCPDCFARYGWGDHLPTTGSVESLHRIEAAERPEHQPRVFSYRFARR